MAPNRRLEPAIDDQITTLIELNPTWSPARVWKAVGGDKVVSRRTVERRVQEMRGNDPGEPWKLTDSPPEDWAAAFELGRWLHTQAGGFPAKDYVLWYIKVRRAFPELAHPWMTYRLALGARRNDGSAIDCLMHQPWADGGTSLIEAWRKGEVTVSAMHYAGRIQRVGQVLQEYESERAAAHQEETSK